MQEESGLKRFFGVNLAELLADRIVAVYPEFDAVHFIADVEESVSPLEMISRTVLIAESLKKYLPPDYKNAMSILMQIYGPENEQETGMFTTGYWLWPVAKFIELYGVDDFDTSMTAIYEITKRHTGEFAIRPLINKYPEKSLKLIKRWAVDTNVHVRRLASEGVRPRLPWAKKLTLFLEDPKPVFEILELLKDDRSKFVQKSVANNINDYLKDNPEKAWELLKKWHKNATEQRKWIIKHALRNEVKRNNVDAIKLAK